MTKTLAENKFWNSIWDTIHVLSMTYENTNENPIAFRCLLECIADFIPKYSKILLENIPNAEELKLHDNKSLFKWSYDFHNYINRTRRIKNKEIIKGITLEDAIEKYTINGKSDWGPKLWKFLHYITANLSESIDELNNEYKTSFVSMIVCFNILLPCPECKSHMNNYLKQNSLVKLLEKISQNGDFNSLYKYFCEFHNAVSKRLVEEKNVKKVFFDCEDSINIYKVQFEKDISFAGGVRNEIIDEDLI